MKVKKRNGRLENFNVDKINECAERASKNLDNVSASEVLIDAKIKLYDKVTTTEIDKIGHQFRNQETDLGQS